MIAPEVKKMYDILVSFLGRSKSSLDETYQLQFSCPRCQDREGAKELNKYHLEVNLQKGYFNCWKCSSMDDEMHGSVYKLIKKFGNNELLNAYKDAVDEFHNSSLYQIHFTKDDFKKESKGLVNEGLELPHNYEKLSIDKKNHKNAIEYLKKRNIGWDIIERFNIGFIPYQSNDFKRCNRIILPSLDKYGDINYWTGRDITDDKRRQRYDNPDVARKDIIFNEKFIQWDADITLVEGPFDHIVTPNSIPLLGKGLKSDFKLYNVLTERSHAFINIFLDADAIETVKSLYKFLNCGKLEGRIRYIPVSGDLDPSDIYKIGGPKGIIQHLRSARQFTTKELILN